MHGSNKNQYKHHDALHFQIQEEEGGGGGGGEEKRREREEKEKRREEKRREEGFKVEAFLDALLLWTQPFAYNSGPRRKRKAKEEWNQKHSCHSFPQRNNKLKKAKEIDGAWYGVK